jgi:hypothetical protein
MSLYTVVFFTGSYLSTCFFCKQVQELHLKNQLNRGYNKLPKKKKSYKKINKAFIYIYIYIFNVFYKNY